MQNFLFTSDIFRGSRYEKGHPLDMDRVWPSVELIRLMGWVEEDQLIKNSPAHISELIKFHDIDYVKALKKAEEDQYHPDNLKKQFNIGIIHLFNVTEEEIIKAVVIPIIEPIAIEAKISISV